MPDVPQLRIDDVDDGGAVEDVVGVPELLPVPRPSPLRQCRKHVVGTQRPRLEGRAQVEEHLSERH